MEIRKIGVVGAGTMGHGIAQACAAAGIEVVLSDVSEEAAQRGLQGIEKNLDRMLAKDRISEEDKRGVLGRVRAVAGLDAMSDADAVIEAVVEKSDVKADVFGRLNEVCGAEAILASNTSSLSLTEIARESGRPDRVIGMHFFNPVPVMKLVEVIRALQTSDETFETVRSLTAALGKTPVEVQDRPGFVVNRMLVPMINEAVFILDEGLASAEEIDNAMKLGANHPIGPLALADLIGIDVCLLVIEVLHEQFGDSKYRPCPLLRKMVEAGYLGRKSGKGFFEY